MQDTTLCLFINDGKILLGMKKRRFGAGKWNHCGGKVRDGETILRAAVRETQEEVGILVNESDAEKIGYIDFYFKDKPEWNQKMHIFLVKKWNGEPVESEELKPQWFGLDEIPYDNMWADDKHWLPMVLAGKKVEGRFDFINEGAQIDGFDIREI